MKSKSSRNENRLYLAITIILAGLLIAGCASGKVEKERPLIKKGVLDLRNWDLAKDGSIALNGEWEFYWNKLISPGESLASAENLDPVYFQVPGNWNGIRISGQELPKFGYASFRVTVLLNRTYKNFGMYVADIRSALAVYVNGKKITTAGEPGISKKSSIPRIYPHVADFASEEDTLEIILHISNFHTQYSGPLAVFDLGTEHNIHSDWEKGITYDFFLFGSLVIMGLYHLGLFLIRRRDRSPLYFGLFCLLISLRTVVHGRIFLNNLFPSMPWELSTRLEIFTFFFAVPLFILFVYSLFTEHTNRQFVKLMIMLGAIYSIAAFLIPVDYIEYAGRSYELMTIIVGIYLIFVLVRSWQKNHEEAGIFLLGFLILFLAVLNDILNSNAILQTANLVSAGLFMFILIQSFDFTSIFQAVFDCGSPFR